MRIFRGIKNLFNPITDYKTGTDYDRHKETVSAFKGMVQRLFVVQKARQVEDFDQAMRRLHFSEQDIQQRKRAFFRLVIVMLLLTIGVFAYFLYHLSSRHILAMMVSFVLTLLCATMTFRYHFWYSQLKQRKLGMTFKEWFVKGLLNK